jgi:hypothetical protein
VGTLVRPQDVVLFGPRDLEDGALVGYRPAHPDVLTLDLAEIRECGAVSAASAALFPP